MYKSHICATITSVGKNLQMQSKKSIWGNKKMDSVLYFNGNVITENDLDYLSYEIRMEDGEYTFSENIWDNYKSEHWSLLGMAQKYSQRN